MTRRRWRMALRSPTARRVRLRLALVIWLTAIYWFSDQPSLPHVPDALLDLVVKKGLHAAAYGVLAWLWRAVLVDAGHRAPGRWALLLSLAYALTDEWHQTFVPGRAGRWADVLVDAVGAGLVLGWAARRDGGREVDHSIPGA